MKRPYLYMTPAANNPNYQHGNLVSILGALHALYVVSVDIKFFLCGVGDGSLFQLLFTKLPQPLEVRESVPQKAFKAEMLGLDCPSNESLQKLAFALESGRQVCKQTDSNIYFKYIFLATELLDVILGDPIRSACLLLASKITCENSLLAALLMSKLFLMPLLLTKNTLSLLLLTDVQVVMLEYLPFFYIFVKIFSLTERKTILTKYVEILVGVSRHAGRIIYLRYRGTGNIEKTVYLVGKGVTYDTGGADIKAGGVMAGMHRDKCGSAAVAAFMKVTNSIPFTLEIFLKKAV